MQQQTIVDRRSLTAEALTLKEILEDAEVFEGLDLSVIYVEDEQGNQFGSAKLVEETLTDGSKVYNLVLCISA